MPNRILLLALSLGAFSIGTDGFVISGPLNRIAADFEVGTPVAGQLVTVFALLSLSRVHPLEEAGRAAYDVHRNLHPGKVGVPALAPREGPGVRDAELRARHLGVINRFRVPVATPV